MEIVVKYTIYGIVFIVAGAMAASNDPDINLIPRLAGFFGLLALAHKSLFTKEP